MAMFNNAWCELPWCEYAWSGPTGGNAKHVQYKLVTPGKTFLHVQYSLVAYNTNLLRILWQIASDGIEAANYTASSEASVDKAVVNMKSDIVEKYWQSTGCTAEWFVFDAGLGKTISLDTLGIIAHNLTNSAVVTIKGSGGSGSSVPADWSVVPVYATLTMPENPDETKLLWVSPEIPANSYRWWRVDIADPTNPATYIRIGRTVAGSALIFNVENCLDSIESWDENFKDEQALNGFTRIANNKALKRQLTLNFKDLDRVGQGNYKLFKRYITYCRDTLKALVIVDPSDQVALYDYTVFSKLSKMPKIGNKYIDSATSYATLDCSYDEGR